MGATLESLAPRPARKYRAQCVIAVFFSFTPFYFISNTYFSCVLRFVCIVSVGVRFPELCIGKEK